ncbi:hypothetical protein SAMN05444162_4941 [Paenibacillaceae bacterium GAS479]|nr:hypothetical protein SAMN05444162_4941 [Paenibacillaceae bacterium GAS479]
MSRSWERKVRRNSSQLNKQRKKSGQDPFKPYAGKVDPTAPVRFKGRNYISPILLISVVVFFSLLPTEKGSGSQTWWLVAAYVALAVLFFLRRPYLQVGSDHVQTRRMMGDKRLNKDEIKSISVQKGYVVIQPVKGGNWVFSRVMNRYPIEQMGERLEQMADAHGIRFDKQ